MNKLKTTKAVSRLSIILAILVPLVFIGVVMLKNQKIPAGFEIIKFGGIMLAIAIAVWISVRITALLATILGDWLDGMLSKVLGNKKTNRDENEGTAGNHASKVIDAEIVDEETADGVWRNGDTDGKAEPDWAKATMDPHAALSSDQQSVPKQKRVLAPPSKTTKTIMVVIAFVVIFGLISNLFDDEWLTLLAPIPGLWAIISLWRIWDPKKVDKTPQN